MACEVVWAEVSAAFPDPALARRALDAVPVAFDAMGEAAATTAGVAWRGVPIVARVGLASVSSPTAWWARMPPRRRTGC